MSYRRLGQSGLFVSELCLGTMTFGGSDGMWGQIGQLRQEEADRLIETALDAGINFIDTANVYADGKSEEIVGQTLRNLGAKREEVVIATKVHGQMGEGPNARGLSRGHIMDQVKASLKRLQLDHIDLYQCHGFDPATPVEETPHIKLSWLEGHCEGLIALTGGPHGPISMALAVSSGVRSATSAIFSPVAGLCTAKVLPGFTHSPPRKARVSKRL